MSLAPGRRRGIVAAQAQVAKAEPPPAPAPKRSKKPGKLSLPK